MAASLNDKFKKTFNSANPNVTFVSTQRSAAATTLICDSLTGWPTDTAVDFITYQLDTDGVTVVAGSQRDWKGIVSSNTITNLTLIAGGTDAGNQVNDIVEMTPTANWANDLIEGILVSHDQDGTLKDDIVTTAKIDDGAISTAKIDDEAVTAGKTAFGGNYSTSEVNTGFTWTDGKPIFKRTFTGLVITSNTTVNTPHGISVDTMIQVIGHNAAGSTIPIYASSTNYISLRADRTNITTFTGSGASSTTGTATIWYTKT